MTIEAGTRLGPYEVVAPIGAGGMGEVYKANDTRLDRTVAIKVLPEHLAESPERKARFEREAKAISQLNHPHICTLYDVGEQDGIDFIVMEYIEGETLAERLKKGALKLDKTLEYGIQIADGLDKAHRAGIVHRDLKPSNIMLTKPGVKLLDFGLAKLIETVSEVSDSDPTPQKSLTPEQTVVGTPRYMAPEQFSGGVVDARTDLYAFGLVLREMLVGKKSAAPIENADVARVVSKSLVADPDERWQTARDLGDELHWIVSRPQDESRRSPKRLRGLVLAVLLVAVVANVAWWLPRGGERAAPGAVMHFRLYLPEQYRFQTNEHSNPLAISRDGSQIVFQADVDGMRGLFLRTLDRLDVTPVAGTVRASTPVFSWDGNAVGFDTASEIHKVQLSGGVPVRISEKLRLRSGAAWGPDGTFVLSSNHLVQVSPQGGAAVPLTHLRDGEVRHAWPQFLPDGKTVLFTVETMDGYRPALVSMESGEHRIIEALGFGRGARYLPPGYIALFADGKLVAARFDLDRLRTSGQAVAVLEGVYSAPDSGLALFTTSDTGTLLYLSARERTRAWRLVRLDRDGSRSALFDDLGYFRSARFSPDGQKVAAARWDRTSAWDIWVYDVATGARDRLATGSRGNPVWSPDGERIAFSTRGRSIVSKAVGGDFEEELLSSPRPTFVRSWAPDGSAVAIYEIHPETEADISILNADGSTEPWLATDFDERSPEFSPDSKWLAYASDETDRYEIYVRPYPGPGQKIPISVGGGSDPLWSPDGRELYYRNGRTLMAVAIETEPTFSVGHPKPLFTGPYASRIDSLSSAEAWYDVSPDGEYFLMIEYPNSQNAVELHVILNWDEELKRLVPTDN